MIALLLLFIGVATACKEIENHKIKPTHYNLEVAWDPDSDVFSGTVSIAFQTKKITSSLKKIVLNSDGLDIATVGAKQGDGKIFVINKFVVDKSNCTLTVYLNEELHSSTKYSLDVSYSGRINEKPEGLYNFTDGGHPIAMTNLYPYHARKVFPCFDRPSIKTPFDITIITMTSNTKSGLGTVISNMPLNSTKSEKQGMVYKFNRTPAIPTYSVFFLISNQVISPYDNSGFDGGLYLHPSFNKNQLFTEYKDLINVNVLKDITKEIHLPKIDVIVVPRHAEKTSSSYGVVVLRNDVMEFDPTKVTSEMKKDAALAILNGIIKVFFGNVLTPAHWGTNFLADSIVHYLKYQGLNEAKGFIGLESRITDINIKTLKETWADTVAPVVVDENAFLTTDNIKDFLNGPSMVKGAAVISMLESFATEKQIRDSLITLLDTKSPANATDLFFALNKGLPDKPVDMEDLLPNWLFQSSYPAVSLSRKEETVYLAESRFSFYDKINNAKDVQPWQIPVNYATRQSPTFGHENVYLMQSGIDANVAMDLSLDDKDWIAINTNGYAPFITSYDDQSWDLLKKELRRNISTFPASMRAKLVSDAFLMAEANKLNYSSLLGVLHYLDGRKEAKPNEDELAPWIVAIDGLQNLWSWIYQSGTEDWFKYDLKQDFKNYVSDRMVKIYNDLGAKPNLDDKGKNILRAKVTNALCNFGYDACLTEMSEAFNALDTVTNLGNDMFYEVICGGVRSLNDTSDWEDVFKKFYHPSDQVEVQKLQLNALACSTTDKHQTSMEMRKLLEILLQEKNSVVPVEMVEHGFASIYTKANHVTQAIYFFLQRQPNFRKDITVDMQAKMLRGIAPHLSTEYHKNQLEKFSKSKDKMPEALKEACDFALATLEARQQLIKEVQDDVAIGLNPVAPTPTKTTPGTPTGPTTTTPSNGTTTPGDITTAKPLAASFIEINVYLVSFLILISFLM